MAFIVNIPTIITLEKNDKFCVNKAGSDFVFIVHAFLIFTFVALFIVVCVAYAKAAQAIRTKLYRGGNPATGVMEHVDTKKPMPTNSTEARRSVDGFKIRKLKPGMKRAGTNKVVPMNVPEIVLNQRAINNTKAGEQKWDSLLMPRTTTDPNPHGQWCTSLQTSKTNQDLSYSNPPTAAKPGAIRSQNARKVNRTTQIMFAVTLVFLLSWIPTWVTYVYREMTRNHRSEAGEVFMLFGKYTFVINTFANPFFYIWMSSVFKENTKKALKSICFL